MLSKNEEKTFPVTMYDYLRARMEKTWRPFKIVTTGDRFTTIEFGTEQHSYNITTNMGEHQIEPYMRAYKIKKIGDMSEVTDLMDEQTQIVSSDILK